MKNKIFLINLIFHLLISLVKEIDINQFKQIPNQDLLISFIILSFLYLTHIFLNPLMTVSNFLFNFRTLLS